MKKILVVVSMMLFGFVGAYAAGTAAGTSVSNSAALSFSVAGTAQPDVTTTVADVFVVDRKIDFVLTNNDGDQVGVAAGSTDQNTTWSLTNEGNADQNFTLAVSQLTGGETIYGDADNNNTTNLTLLYSTDGGTTWNANAQIDIATDATVLIRVSADIDANTPDGDVMNIQVIAKAVTSGGGDETATGGADDQAAVDTVLAEAASPVASEAANNGKFYAWGGYVVGQAVLTLTKTSCVLDDNVSAAADSKRIPGATIIYMFDIENTGSAGASAIEIRDDLDSALDYATVTSEKVEIDKGSACSCTNGTAAGGVAATNGNTGADPRVTINHDGALTVSGTNHTCVSFEVKIK